MAGGVGTRGCTIFLGQIEFPHSRHEDDSLQCQHPPLQSVTNMSNGPFRLPHIIESWCGVVTVRTGALLVETI